MKKKKRRKEGKIGTKLRDDGSKREVENKEHERRNQKERNVE